MSEYENRPKLKCAIYGLVKGYGPRNTYSKVIRRNKLLHENFNSKFNYDMILFHEGNIQEDHQEKMCNLTPNLRFIDISDRCFINTDEVTTANETGGEGINNLGYKHMCRFNSRFVFEYLKDYDYIMRADDDIYLFSQIDYDLFEFMDKNNFVYGYGRRDIDSHQRTSDTLIPFVTNYIEKNNVEIMCDLEEINMQCFYNNFFIAKVSFFRSSEVQNFIMAVDESMGFFSYRWGDNPIHALIVKMFSDPSRWHKFTDFSYTHASHKWDNSGKRRKDRDQWKIDESHWQK